MDYTWYTKFDKYLAFLLIEMSSESYIISYAIFHLTTRNHWRRVKDWDDDDGEKGKGGEICDGGSTAAEVHDYENAMFIY